MNSTSATDILPYWWMNASASTVPPSYDFTGNQFPDLIDPLHVFPVEFRIAEKPVKADPKPPSRWIQKQIRRRGWQ